jgi:hypothetical protein
MTDNMPVVQRLIMNFSGLLTPLIAIIVAYIAYRQWRTADNRLKLDMFERRLAIHSIARDLIASVVTSGVVDNSMLLSFVHGTRQARWLLDTSLQDYLDAEMYKSALCLQNLQSEEKCLSGDDLTGNVQKQSELKIWFTNQYGVLDSWFDKFLKLS